ncbi:hypothetical protein IGI04_029974, partial [Brassica rapa subsp. trilocularis]
MRIRRALADNYRICEILRRFNDASRRDLMNTDEFPTRSDDADELYKLKRTRRSLSQHLRNTNKGNYKGILKIDEVGELFEEARGTLNKNVSSSTWCSPIRHGSMMMIPSTPLAWRFDSGEFTLKEDYNDFFLN